MGLELGTLEWDTFNPDCLIRISNVDTFKFLLNPPFFEKAKSLDLMNFELLSFIRFKRSNFIFLCRRIPGRQYISNSNINFGFKNKLNGKVEESCHILITF